MKPDITIRIARPDEYDDVALAYRLWGYRGGVLPSDVVFVAHAGNELIGIVRRTVEHGTMMLRGMHVAPDWRGRGVGTLLQGAFEADLPPGPCVCMPYVYLEPFYAVIGFERMAEADAPQFLLDRLAQYRAEGRDMMLMRRASR